ncbi:uncharacterized protein Bfra_001134 [Botrytis fragariae]|uniref:Uncharacterized protein n=1 Tax=Botrytis fragariae TaxID=1964551 RepID=A0A8H6B3Z1_9HELO|nr:uncharacterized protein Bfra_001134 [Botrytis fragariae]KAF5878961.1 hypothetical protein Bfra_001134 [Botrytis fragariae]
MPSRRFGRPAVVVATLIAFSVLILVFIGEGLKAFVRKDGVSLGKRDITFGLNWQTTISTPSTARSEILALHDCSPDSLNTPTSLIIDRIQSEKHAMEESTTVSAILAQGTNTVSFALQGRSDMVSVILADINSLVTHPTGVSNTVRDATGLLAIAMAKSRPSISTTSVQSASTPTDLHSLAAFELSKKAEAYNVHHNSHGESCDCAACISSTAASIPITIAPPLPTHELMARAFVARAETVTVTISVCSDSASNSTGSANQSPPPPPGPKNSSPAPEISNPASSRPKNPSPASNATSSGPKNPVPGSENSNATSPSRPNPPFTNSTNSGAGSGGADDEGAGNRGAAAGSAGSGAGGAASASGAVASAASLFSGNTSQPTGNAQSSNKGSKPSTTIKSTPAENTSPATSASISPPIASQASAASTGIDNSIFALITPAVSNIVYVISTIGPIAVMVVMGQIWLL